MKNHSARRIAGFASLVWVALMAISCGGGGGGGGETDGRGAPRYDLSGTVLGLVEGPIEISIGPDKRILEARVDSEGAAQSVPFKFRFPAGTDYTLTVDAESLTRAAMLCDVIAGSGRMPAAPVSDVRVDCRRKNALRLLAGRLPLTDTSDGPVSEFGVSTPEAITVDKGGNVYVASAERNVIRKISPAGTVSTFAGKAGESGWIDGIGPAARFDNPKGLAADKDGNVYVADMGNFSIRKITPLGMVSTLAGKKPLNPGSREVMVDGTGSNARFIRPQSIALDANGTIYVLDGSSTIRKVQSSGEVSTFFSDIPNSSFSMRAVGVNLDGSVFIGAIDVFGGETIVRLSPNGRVIQSFEQVKADCPPRSTCDGPFDDVDDPWRMIELAPSADGGVYFSASSFGTVHRVGKTKDSTLAAGAPGKFGFRDGTGKDALFAWPRGIATDSRGNLYIADFLNNAIRKMSPEGQVTTLVGIKTAGATDGLRSAASFDEPAGMARDAGGNLYVADRNNHTVRKISPDGLVRTLAGSPGKAGFMDGNSGVALFREPKGVTVDAAGNALVSDSGNCAIRRISPDGLVTTLAGGSCAVDGDPDKVVLPPPGGIATDNNGNVYFFDSAGDLRRIASNGDDATVVRGIGTGGRSLVFGSDEHLYATTQKGVYRITLSGEPTLIAESQTANDNNDPAKLTQPTGLAVDARGNLILGDGSRLRMLVRRQDGTYSLSTLAGTVDSLAIELGPRPKSIGRVNGVAVVGDRIYFTSQNSILFINR